jgi:hypothetical protein
MKHLKKLVSNALVFMASVVAIVLTLSLLGQALALGMYALVLTLIISVITYLVFRRPQD